MNILQYNKPQVQADVKYLLYLMLIGVMTSLAILHYPIKPIHLISPIPLDSFTSNGHAYKEPTLNPNISEREQNKQLIVKVWGKDSWTGLNIARCESGFRTAAINRNTNGTTDEGVFQENTVHNMPGMLNAVANISYAYTQYLKQGTGPWYSSQSCWSSVIAEK